MDKKMKLIGRTIEYERLNACMSEDTAQLVIVYGRRRVGKTFLINQYFNNRFAFKVTGIYGQNRKVQLQNFITELSLITGIRYKVPRDWMEAFGHLREYVGTLDRNEKQVLFFDEMPWMDTQKSDFLPAFEWFWNGFASALDHIVLVACGSATSWMDEKLANNKGGLFNRQTCKLFLEPFNLCEAEQYLLHRNIRWSRYEITECYMIMGGIPYYLSLLKPSKSFRQNIDDLFFSNRGELWDEFEHLYRTLFSNSDSYIKVVEALSKKTNGLTREEIASQTRIPAGGDLTKILNNLSLSGFVRLSRFYNNKKKNALYQLADYYTLFYFRYIKDRYGKDENYWSNSVDNPARRSWAGLTFEQVCKDHISQIKRKLGITGILSDEYSWFESEDEEEGRQGAQIDLLIDRRDHVVTLCEMKYSLGEYVINKEYDMNLRNKLEAFRIATNCKKTLQLLMITTYGVKPNKYSGLLTNQITLDDLFKSKE
ncbi:MAG: ATP-binding protein [Eubacteriales bacterium]|nr:ATP-binding protein [Eubacteriales bacterium]